LFSNGGKLMAATKYEYYETGDDGYKALSADGAGLYDYGQTFTPSTSHILQKVELKLFRLGTVGNVTIEIRPTSAGIPLGTDAAYGEALASVTTDCSAITTTAAGEWVVFTLNTPIALTASTMYAIVVASTIYENGAAEVRWRYDGAASTYANGTSCIYNDGWSAYANDPTGDPGGTKDLLFREYGGPTIGVSPPVANVEYTKKLVAIGANEVWYESSAGTMSPLAGSIDDLDVSKGLDMVEAYGKVFIANGTNLKVADFINVKLHTIDIQPTDKVYPRHGTVITGDSSGAKMVVDYITDLDGDTYIYGKLITDATFVDTDVCEAIITEGDVSFTLDADQVDGPHWYDWTTYGNLAGDDDTYGAMPDQATILALYQGRIVLAGDEDYPHMWYQSRQANPWNWLYGINDAQSAVAGNDADAGEIGDVVTAIIPYKDDFCIYGAAGSIWYLIGNAAEGGVILELSLTAGILASKAWCWDSADNLYILATTGIIKIPRGFGIPENLTGQSYPNFIKDLDYDDVDDRLTMAYDRIRHGIHICKTELADGTNKNWWFDLKIIDEEGRVGGLFPETFPEECGVCSAFYYESNDPTYRDLLFGCYDGYIRFSDDAAKDDNIGADVEADVEAIDSYVCFGPMPLAKENMEGKITSLVGVLAGGGIGSTSPLQPDSNDVDYEIFTELSAAKVLERLKAVTRSPDIAGVISAPGRIRGSIKRQTVRGAFAGIRVSNDDAGETWALERLLVNAKELGRIR